MTDTDMPRLSGEVGRPVLRVFYLYLAPQEGFHQRQSRQPLAQADFRMGHSLDVGIRTGFGQHRQQFVVALRHFPDGEKGFVLFIE